MQAKCPLCSTSISVQNINWECPACSRINNDWDIMQNCESCLYAPIYMKCPSCRDDFEIANLLGAFRSQSGDRLPPRRRPVFGETKSFQIKDLNLLLAAKFSEEEQDLLAAIHPDLLEVSFEFPCKIDAVAVHTVARAPDSRIWAHFWIYPTSKPDFLQANLGQIAIGFTSKPSGALDAECNVIDVGQNAVDQGRAELSPLAEAGQDPFVFKCGERAHNLTQLRAIAFRNPQDTIFHITEGHFPPWLRQIGETEKAGKIENVLRSAFDVSQGMERELSDSEMAFIIWNTFLGILEEW